MTSPIRSCIKIQENYSFFYFYDNYAIWNKPTLLQSLVREQCAICLELGDYVYLSLAGPSSRSGRRSPPPQKT